MKVVKEEYKPSVFSEVIMMTHNEYMHQYNLENNIPGENLLWVPEIQESKTSSYGGKNIRYQRHLKAKMIKVFKDLHKTSIPWNRIRYIF
jgi:hypothetical protein